jgi:hypothetical protein
VSVVAVQRAPFEGRQAWFVACCRPRTVKGTEKKRPQKWFVCSRQSSGKDGRTPSCKGGGTQRADTQTARAARTSNA